MPWISKTRAAVDTLRLIPDELGAEPTAVTIDKSSLSRYPRISGDFEAGLTDQCDETAVLPEKSNSSVANVKRHNY